MMYPMVPTSRAHGLDAHRAQVEFDGTALRVTVTPGLALWPSADVNGDGLLTRPEVADAREDLRQAFEKAFVLRTATGAVIACDDVSVSTIGQGADHVRVSLRCPTTDPALHLDVAGLDGEPLHVQARALRADAPGVWEALGPPETHVVDAAGGDVWLFGAAPPPTKLPASGWGVAFAAIISCVVLWVRARPRTVR
ncbi:MAG: hypothetical protein RLZZ383_3018 [Pseudomonadota bacterium]